MTPEFGLFLLIALCVLSLPSVVILTERGRRAPWFRVWIKRLSAPYGLMALAMIGLSLYGFVRTDFSVLAVMNHSWAGQPLGYRIAAVWSQDRGSLLLWLLILGGGQWWLLKREASLWLAAGLVQGLMGILAGIMACVANPFERLLPASWMGAGLNPSLQDPSVLIHPPILHGGYVGYGLVFALGWVLLVSKNNSSIIMSNLRFFACLAWSLLTLGLVLGSFWAYYELGWGGFWFWDPVENASLLPWLMGTVLLHQRSAKKWTGLWAMMPFMASVLSTLTVRSGVIQSVHSFAFNGPQTCGLLVFFSALMGIMSMGIARRLRMDDFLHDEHKPKYIITKYLLWFQMGLLSLFFVIIVLGLIWMAITGQDIDRSFFDTLAYGGFWLAIGPLWVVSLKGAHKWRRVGAALVAGMTLCALLYKALPMPLSLYQHIMFWGVGVLSVGSIVALWWGSTVRKNVRLAHSGLLLFFWAVSLTMVGQYQETILLKPGKSLGVYGMQVSLLGLRTLKPDNKSYQSIQAKVRLWTPRSAMIFYPERRLYAAQQSLQTEIALHNGPLGVYQVMLGDQHKDGWSLHISYHFMVQWIWLAGLLMIAGVMRSVCPTWLCLFKNL